MGQNVNDTIDPNAFNQQLMEKAVFDKVNEYRVTKGKKELIYNAVIYKVADDQLQYINEKGELTHEQNTPNKRYVRDRVKLYTKQQYFHAGENLAQTSILIPTYQYDSKGRTKMSVAYTYQQAADYMFYAWKQSEFHNKNMLSDVYQMSAIAVGLDPEDNTLTGVQVFVKIGR